MKEDSCSETEYPKIDFEISEEHFKVGALPNEVFTKNVRRALYENKIENYGFFINGITCESYCFDLTTNQRLSSREVKWRRFKANVMGMWFHCTYKIFYKRRYK